MKYKRIKQINNLVIKYNEHYNYSVWTPYKICLEDRLSLNQAEEFCKETLDFLN